MRWIFPTLLIVTINAFGQDGINFGEIAQESSESIEEHGYYDPVFKWDMEGRVQVALNEGINYLKEGNPTVALPQLEEAVKLAPEQWIVHYYKGICHKQLRQYKEARQEFLRVNELNDKNIFNYLELGKTYDLLRDYDNGERYFERAAKIDPTNAAPVYMLANHCLKQAMIDRARRLYKQCLKINEKMLDAEVKLALIDLFRMPKANRPIKYLEDVLAKDSMHQQALIFHGILKLEEDPKASLRDWDRLVRLNPGNSEVRFLRGMLLSKTGQYDKAFSDLRKVIDEAQLNANNFEGQQSDTDKRIDIEYAGYYVVANVYGFPDDDASRLKKAYCLLFDGKFDEALRSVNLVKNHKTAPLCLFLKGVAYEHKGEHNKAYHAYDSALRLDNDIFDAHKKRGIYLMELKEWGYAEGDFNELLRINPEAYVTYRFRGLARYNASRFQGALDDYTRYLEHDSTNLVVLAERGVTYRKLGQVLPSTRDLLKSKNFTAIDEFYVITKEIDKLLSAGDSAKANWWLSEFTKYDVAYINARKLHLKLLISQKKWAEVRYQSDQGLLKPKNTDDSWETYDDALSIYSKVDVSFLVTAKAISLIHTGDLVRSIRELNKAIEYDKKNADAYVARAQVQLKTNNKEGAKSDLKKAADLGSQEARDLLAQLN